MRTYPGLAGEIEAKIDAVTALKAELEAMRASLPVGTQR